MVRRSRRRRPTAAGPGSGRPRARAGYRSPVPAARRLPRHRGRRPRAHALHAPADGVEPRFVDVARHGAQRSPTSRRTSWSRSRPTRAAGRRRARRSRSSGPADAGAARASTASCGTPGPDDRTPGARGRCRSTTASTATSAPSRRPPRALFVGRSTDAPRVDPHARQARPRRRPLHARAHRRRARRGARARADVGHRAHRRRRPRLPVAGAAAPRRRPAAAVASACSPTCGLEPGHRLPRDRLARRACVTLLIQLRLRPDAYERVRDPRAAEGRGAPRVARVAADRRATCLQDLRVFGRNTLNA